MSDEKLWTRDFIIVSVINFLVFLTYFLLMVIIAAYAVDTFRSSTSTAGLVAGMFVIGALLGRVVGGRLIEATGSRKLLLIGTVSFVLTSVAYFAAFDLPVLIAVRLLQGIAFGIASTATGTIVAQIVPPWRHGEGIGYFSISAVLAVAMGPFVGIYLMKHAGFTMVFLVCAILAFIGFVTSCFVSEPPQRFPTHGHAQKTVNTFHISRFIEYSAIPISIVLMILCLTYSVVVAFISLYTKEMGLPEAASFYFLSYSAAVLVSRPFSGRLLDLKGANFIIYPCLFLYALGMLVFSGADRGITFLVAGAIMGLGYGNLISCSQAISIKSAPPHRLGLATATFFTFVDLGFGIGPYLLGYLVPFTGYRVLYLLMVALTLATVVLYYFLIGRKQAAVRNAKA